MTNDEIKLKDMEERIKKLENKVFGQWIDQYGVDIVDISEEPLDPEPYVPVAACSQEAMYEAMRKHDEWAKRHQGI